uniref:Uncharacterized protein n=1 Tax=Arundo donax TaxID=35708 RepID=A0A0A8YFM9_ARUDO
MNSLKLECPSYAQQTNSSAILLVLRGDETNKLKCLFARLCFAWAFIYSAYS